MLPLGSSLLQLFRFGNLEKMMKKKRDLNFFLKGMGKSLEQSNQGKTTKSFSF